FASYGTPSGNSTDGFTTGACDAQTTAPIVSVLCIGQPICSIAAESSIFGDPCYGTDKRLSVAAECVPSNVIGGSVSEGSSLNLACPSDQVISSVVFASYGMPTGAVPHFVAAPWCDQPGVADYVSLACLEQNSCNVLASTQYDGRPSGPKLTWCVGNSEIRARASSRR
ncbi:hypothetical protein ACHHYP_17505, partial [Achlya hypogyna]